MRKTTSPGVRQRVLRHDTKDIISKRKSSINWTSWKLKTFALRKTLSKIQLKVQTTDWEKILVGHIPDRRLVSKTYKEVAYYSMSKDNSGKLSD